MATKLPLYEAAIRRTERLAGKTAKELKISCFQADVKLITKALRKERNQGTPLALHFIDLAGRELCEKRGAVAKTCLLAAKAMCDNALLHHLAQCLFPQAFTNQPGAHDMDDVAKQISSVMQQMMSGQVLPMAVINFSMNPGTGHKAPKPPGFLMGEIGRN